MRCKWTKAHNLNWSLIWNDSKGGARTIKTKPVMLIHYRTGMSWRLKQREDWWISPWKIGPDLKPQTSRNRGYLVSWPPVSMLSFWELSRFQPRLCVASIFHASDNAPQPLAASLLFIVYCSRLTYSARHSEPCNSVISASSILACTTDKKPNTEVMNKSQYSTYTHTDTRRRPVFLVYFWLFFRILNPVCCTASCSINGWGWKLTAGINDVCIILFLSAIHRERHWCPKMFLYQSGLKWGRSSGLKWKEVPFMSRIQQIYGL